MKMHAAKAKFNTTDPAGMQYREPPTPKQT
jgi:hypothetical protein